MLVRRSTSILIATPALTSLDGCVYLRLLRPSAKQMTPGMALLVDYLPPLHHPNDAIVGRVVTPSWFTFSEYST